jgi:hypothetical protein
MDMVTKSAVNINARIPYELQLRVFALEAKLQEQHQRRITQTEIVQIALIDLCDRYDV